MRLGKSLISGVDTFEAENSLATLVFFSSPLSSRSSHRCDWISLDQRLITFGREEMSDIHAVVWTTQIQQQSNNINNNNKKIYINDNSGFANYDSDIRDIAVQRRIGRWKKWKDSFDIRWKYLWAGESRGNVQQVCCCCLLCVHLPRLCLLNVWMLMKQKIHCTTSDMRAVHVFRGFISMSIDMTSHRLVESFDRTFLWVKFKISRKALNRPTWRNSSHDSSSREFPFEFFSHQQRK